VNHPTPGRIAAAGLLLLACATAAAAQTPQPIGTFAVDARVVFPNYPDDPSIASAIGAEGSALPGRGLGLALGAHVYPGRRGVVTFGIGAEWLKSRGKASTPISTDPPVDGPELRTGFSAFSPQVSFNFGHRQGWSYLTAGYGWAALTTELVATPTTGAGHVRMYDYGGGARWFAREHVGLSLDIRWYKVASQEAAGTSPAYPASSLLVLSAGVSFK
jgi:hypothetical protein